MVFSYNFLQSFFKKKLPSPKQLSSLLTMKSFEVSEILSKRNDTFLDIDVLPNRAPDCFSYWGMAKEISALTGLPLNIPKIKPKEDKNLKTKNFLKCTIQGKEGCKRYTARFVFDVKIAPSPEWMQDVLKKHGIKPINNIVDITNYVMLETGQPLHAFDFEKLKGECQKEIIVRFAKEGEEILTLDNQKFKLDSEVLVIADKGGVVALAGIKGGKRAEITPSTKKVILEAANFDPQIIRKTSRKLNLKTDASLRFEHGIDPNLTEIALNRAIQLIEKTKAGKPAKGIVDVYLEKRNPKTIKLRIEYLEKLLGEKIPPSTIIKILTSLGMKCKKEKKGILKVIVPTQRLDIALEEDLIEEVGRIYGYEKITPKFPQAVIVPPKRNLEIFWENVAKDILKEAKFTEVYNYSFIGDKEKEIFEYNNENLIELKNPISSNFKFLRPSLIPNLLKTIKNNISFYENIKIFELGKVFLKSNKNKIEEKKAICGMIEGDREVFFEIKGVVDSFLEKLGISDIWYDEYQPTPKITKRNIWHKRKCAEVKIGNIKIGFLGEISPRILEKLEINQRVGAFHLDFEILQKLASEEHEYKPLSKFPATVRDIAILVPRTTKVVEILNIINAVGGRIVRDVDLFDMYEGENIPEGKKNLAFHIIYQAEDRTLTSKEVNEIQQKIIEALEQNPEWEVRKLD